MTQKLFSELGLSEPLLKAVHRLGYEKAAPIQAEAIPLILAGHDIIGQSQTGSGKTAAFAIPAIEMVDPQIRGVQSSSFARLANSLYRSPKRSTNSRRLSAPFIQYRFMADSRTIDRSGVLSRAPRS
jgi:superfamily II DNA/RNA helicase